MYISGVWSGHASHAMHDHETFLNTKEIIYTVLYSLHIIHKYTCIFIAVLGGGEVIRKYLGKTRIFRAAI